MSTLLLRVQNYEMYVMSEKQKNNYHYINEFKF